MNVDKSQDYLIGLVNEFRKLPCETAWLEFKTNNGSPEEIGEYLSALSNSAALNQKANAYLIWGINDTTHDIVGTTFDPFKSKKGNEPLENWLLRLLNPRLLFRFYMFELEDKAVVILEIPRASDRPTQFSGTEYIRVGSCRQKLKEYPKIERDLWRVFETTPFEELKAMERVDTAKVLMLLDYPTYFDMLSLPLPANRDGILTRLAEDHLITPNLGGSWDITNLGAILFAKNLVEFKRLSRKAMRVILYEGNGRQKTIREQNGHKGYASGFEGLIDFVNALLPRNEILGKALRKEVPMYPEPAIRELVANALIHQDFSITGCGPMIEIFTDRMEITNPGLPLVNTNRFLDTPPRSRNETLASLMRRAGICEERGSGVDKVVFETEFYQLPAPMFEAPENSTRVILFSHKELNDMDISDKTRACYLHACLKFVERNPMTNSSLRDRFGIQEHNSAIASRIIRDTMAENLIKPYNPEQGKKYAKYVPFWA